MIGRKTLMVLAVVAGPAMADAPYAGQQTRALSSLSASDIEDLRAGRGWGLAKPAELNGFPGPSHALDLAEALALSDRQRSEITRIFRRMNDGAREVGAAFIAAERALDAAFRSRSVDGAVLARSLTEAGRLRTQLREIHLSAHLETAPLLTRHQRVLYSRLRGYDEPHPPAGHGGRRH